MRRQIENQGNRRTLTEYFSPRSKEKDLILQERSLPQLASFVQETPMKPSQVPKKLPHPPPRRMLPLPSPELCHKIRLGTLRHSRQHLGPRHSSGFAPSSPVNIGSSANRTHPMPRDRADYSAQSPESFCSPLVVISPTDNGTTAHKPQPSTPSVSHPASPQCMKELSNHSPSPHIRRDQETESRLNLISGRENVTAHRQESNKAQSRDVMSSINTIQLHRPPMTSSINTREAQEVCSLPHSLSEHRSSGYSQSPLRGYQPSLRTHSSDRCSSSSLPIMHSPVAPSQDTDHKWTPSSEKLTPEVDLNQSSQKRCRVFEDCGNSAKKLHLRGEYYGHQTQAPEPTVGNLGSTSLVSEPSSGHSSVLEPSLKTTDNLLCTKPTSGQSAYLELLSTLQSPKSSRTSLSPNHCIKRQRSMEVKQASVTSSQKHTETLMEIRSPSKSRKESLTRRSEESDKRDKSSSLSSSEAPKKDTGRSPHFQLSSHSSGHTHCNTSVLDANNLSRKSDSSTNKPASKPNSGSLSCRPVKRNKVAHLRRPPPIADDINELFTPDPKTYVISPAHQTEKPKINEATKKSSASDKGCSSKTVSSSSTTVTGASCHKIQNITATGSPHAVDTKVSSLSSVCYPQVALPTVALERVKPEKIRAFCTKDDKLKNSHEVTCSDSLDKDENVKCVEKQTAFLPNNVRPCTLDMDSTAPIQPSTFHRSESPLLQREASEVGRKQVNEEDPVDPVDVELDRLDLSRSSHSSEEEQLVSLQEMMKHATKPPDTPEKGTFSEPSTPGYHSCQSKTQLLPSTTESGIYKNNLDQMLKEINSNRKAKEIETQLLTACQEDLLRIAEYEEAEENREEGISIEQQEFLQRYSLMSSAIREVPPGEVVFNLETFGRIFNHDTLQLRNCMVNPQGSAQKTLLWSSPAQLKLHLNIGLFQEAYDSHLPCPAPVTRFLFKMMSVHNERMVSEKILQALCDIACSAAYQIVKNESKIFKVWVPSLADVALVLLNMGAAFVTLFPFENLQPTFTESDLLEDIYIKSESPSTNKEQRAFPEHNYNNMLKYLCYCMALCPRAYSDDELLLLLTVLGRVSMDTRLVLQSSVELYPLQYKIVNNIRDWNTTLPRICLALAELTDDHHNMCLLVQLLPDSTRGKQLRQHLSLCMISKLLDGSCTYIPTEKQIQLSDLRPYLCRMRPTTLLHGMLRSSSRSQKDKEDMATLDQQSYYLCHNLLTLAKEASNFLVFPTHQKEQLQHLCFELETHVKCDIRESEKCLYRSKVKDLVARIYTKWEMLLRRTKPLHGRLYDYWQPSTVDTLTSSQEQHEMEDGGDGEQPVMQEKDEEESSRTEENEGTDEDDTMCNRHKTSDNTKPEKIEVDIKMDDTVEMEESEVVDEQMEAGNIEHTDVETTETSQHDQAAPRELL